MNYLTDGFHIGIKDHRNKTHPTENIILGLQKEPKPFWTQYQVQNNTQMRKNRKDIKNDNDELVVKKQTTK